MKIGILHTGLVPEPLKENHKSYAKMFMSLLESRSKAFTFRTYEVLEMDFPVCAKECDGWIITGSKYGVYEDHPWIEPLSDLVRKIAKIKSPLLGVCFGHQLIAQALGGQVESSEKGWGLGLDTYRIKHQHKPECMSNINDTEISLNIFHQDQVTRLPEGAKVFAKSDFCNNAGFYIDQHILTIQAHPEFSLSYNQDLLHFYRDSAIPLTVIDCALVQLENEAEKLNKTFLDSIKQFFLPRQV